ncbi:MAG: energy transducer TonB, partial [Bacteroidota bacterium]
MKKLITLIPIFFCMFFAQAQTEPTDGVYRLVDEMPRFPGCEDIEDEIERRSCSENELLTFIYENVSYPAIARENGIEGICVVQFTIEKNGSISDIKLVRDIGGGCGEESVRVIQEMIEQDVFWIPGRQNGENVRVRFTFPIKYK